MEFDRPILHTCQRWHCTRDGTNSSKRKFIKHDKTDPNATPTLTQDNKGGLMYDITILDLDSSTRVVQHSAGKNWRVHLKRPQVRRRVATLVLHSSLSQCRLVARRPCHTLWGIAADTSLLPKNFIMIHRLPVRTGTYPES